MRAVVGDNLDLDIALSGAEIASASRCPGREFPVLECDVFDESGESVGRVKLQKTVAEPLGDSAVEDRGVYFLKTGPREWFIQLGSAFYDLRHQGSVMRRMPFYRSQLLIYGSDN